MLNGVDGVWSLSEPDPFFDLVMRRHLLDPAEVPGLVRACVRLSFRPPPARRVHTMAIKFRSQSLFQAEHFHATFPDAAFVFLYRDGVGWARSFWYFLQNSGCRRCCRGDPCASTGGWVGRSQAGAVATLPGRGRVGPDRAGPRRPPGRCTWRSTCASSRRASPFSRSATTNSRPTGRRRRRGCSGTAGCPHRRCRGAGRVRARTPRRGRSSRATGGTRRLSPTPPPTNSARPSRRHPRIKSPDLLLPDIYSASLARWSQCDRSILHGQRRARKHPGVEIIFRG